MPTSGEAKPLLGAPPLYHHHQQEHHPPRSTLSLRERRLKNLHKRVKLRSKRLRAHWPKIAAFLDLQSTVALASTCRRMKQVLQDDQVWWHLYESERTKRLSQLLVDYDRKIEENPADVKQNLQRLVHARRVLDPTNALQARLNPKCPMQRRLQEAEREVHRIAAWQRKTQELFRTNIAFVLVFCCISLWSFLYVDDGEISGDGHRSSSTRLPDNQKDKHQGSALKTFLVALDILSLVAVLIVSFGSPDTSRLGTAALLGLLQCATMAFMLFAWASIDQILHAFIVLLTVVFNVVMAKLKQREYEQEVATFVSKY